MVVAVTQNYGNFCRYGFTDSSSSQHENKYPVNELINLNETLKLVNICNCPAFLCEEKNPVSHTLRSSRSGT